MIQTRVDTQTAQNKHLLNASHGYLDITILFKIIQQLQISR